ncbi:hypothetical protein ACFL6U_03825 [Planctomycetota bacterium]
MSGVEPYTLTMAQVAQSGRACIVIDDSGTPGQVAESMYLHPERKTWVAVLMTHCQIEEVCAQLPGALDELKSQTGANEFHFMDIYRGSGRFASVSFERRLAFFAFMQHIFTQFMFPVLVQTFDPVDLRDLKTRFAIPKKVGPFNTKHPSDAALLFLLLRIKRYLERHPNDFVLPGYVVLDEGFRPSGRSIEISTWGDVLQRSSIYTARSEIFLPIQLADYAAFCVGRCQWLLSKEKRSRSDDVFFPIIADLRANIVNLSEMIVDLGDWKPDDYGRMIEQDRDRKGLSRKYETDP